MNTIRHLENQLTQINKVNVSELKTLHCKIATEYSLLLNHQKTLEHYLLALQYANSEPNSVEKNTIFYNISAQFTNLNKLAEGERYARIAVENLNQLDTNTRESALRLGSCYSLLGSIYNGGNNYDESINNLTKAEIKFNQHGFDSLLADVFINRGCIKMDAQLFKEAKVDFLNALKIYKNKNNHEGIATTYINLCSLLFNAYDSGIKKNKNDLYSCLAYLDSATIHTREFPESMHRLNCYNYKNIIYETLGKVDSANKYKLNFYELNEIINNKELTAKIGRIEQDFNVKLKDSEIERLKNQNTILKNEQRIKTQMHIFVIVVVLLIALLALSFYQIKTLNLKRKSYEIQQKVSRAQMDPHFTFNAINSVQEYILLNEPDKAHLFLSKFSRVIRNFLNNNQKTSIDLKSELKFLNDYIELESERFRKRIHFTVKNLSNLQLNEIIILPSTLQPLLENAIWHGFSDEQENCIIELTILNNKKILQLMIKDNGQGSENYYGSAQSKGLRLIEERINLINHNRKGVFSIHKSIVGGTIVELQFPLNLKLG